MFEGVLLATVVRCKAIDKLSPAKTVLANAVETVKVSEVVGVDGSLATNLT